jgi:hypothetical protein
MKQGAQTTDFARGVVLMDGLMEMPMSAVSLCLFGLEL